MKNTCYDNITTTFTVSAADKCFLPYFGDATANGSLYCLSSVRHCKNLPMIKNAQMGLSLKLASSGRREKKNGFPCYSK